ncbi:4Fe-4S binding protein [bacterium]|nr:4Fe-4S dicluster domain-containing protein [Candidatus Omnitrophota bacterium]MBU2528803.1 4Fe-4S binding protein [bacterium]MBU3929082.1 4Fe-4S binding protein [bacterium]MBU4122308.1 4Fe-4S binding protein [bacterium]
MYFAAKVDKEKCNGCKACILSCPEPNVISFNKDEKKIDIDAKRCKNCELCVTGCPSKAIEIVLLQD